MDAPKGAAVGGERAPVAGRHYATCCHVDFTQDEVDFMMAMESYKRRTGHAFPTWSEALHVLRELGFRRVPAGE